MVTYTGQSVCMVVVRVTRSSVSENLNRSLQTVGKQSLMYLGIKKGQPVKVGLNSLETRMNAGFPQLVPGAGLEPARLAAGDFESPESTNFTTRAVLGRLAIMTHGNAKLRPEAAACG